MKRLLPYWRELVLLVSGVGFVWSVLLWIRQPPKTAPKRAVLSLVIVGTAILFILLLRYLWRNKWKGLLARAGAAMVSRVSRFLVRLFERFGNIRGGKTVVSGKTTLIFQGIERDIPTRKPPKKKKWKQLGSARERLGYLYQMLVTLRIRGGTAVYASDTPTDVQKRTEGQNTEDEKRLLSLYIRSRYDERNEPTDLEVSNLKDRLDYK